MAERARLEIACGSKAHRGFESPPLRVYNFHTARVLDSFNEKAAIGSTPKRVDFNERRGQHQSQWILMKDAALDKDPQSIIFKVFIAVGQALY